jgi:hypothetical protein
MSRAPESVDKRVELAFSAHSPYRTWVIEIEAPSDAEPTNLYAALVSAGWRDATMAGSPAARKWDRVRHVWAPYLVMQRIFVRDGASLFSSAWSEAERVQFIRAARATLRRFGFVAVPMIKSLVHQA